MSRSGRVPSGRQRARELLVQALYQWQLTGHDINELTRQFSENTEYAHIDREYFRQLLEIVVEDAPAFDRMISRFAVRAVEQLDAVGRAILLVALAEFRHRPDVPRKVVINEAVELAKRYGATDSYRFVNAVLDKISKAEDFRGDDAGV